MVALAVTIFKKRMFFNKYSAFKKGIFLMNIFVCQKAEVRRYANGEAM